MFSGSIISNAVAELKANLFSEVNIDSLEKFFRLQGHVWRHRTLPPGQTLYLFIQQILHGNTSCSHVRHFSEERFTASAYCEARKRLPLGLLEKFQCEFVSNATKESPERALWRGHRVLLEDGSGCSMPDTKELRDHFGQPGAQRAGCGFPVASLLFLFDRGTGYLQKMLVSRLSCHDMSQASRLHSELKEGDILVGDRAFCSFAHIALLLSSGIKAVFRMNASHQVDFRRKRNRKSGYHKVVRGERLRKLGAKDHLITWSKTNLNPKWLCKAEFNKLPETIEVRELQYELKKPGFRSRTITIVTTLLDPQKYPKKAIAELYGMRWEVETNIRHLKITMKMDVLRSKTVEGIMRELQVFCLVYNLVRRVMFKIAGNMKIPPERLSFIDTLRLIQNEFIATTVNMIIVNPRRPGRMHPRVLKRRPKAYPRMTTKRKSCPGFSSTEQLVMA